MGFEFNKCCFCIELRTGCLIIGYLNLIYLIISILLSIIAFAVGGEATLQGKNAHVKTAGAAVMAITGVMLVIFILFLAFTIVLLIGVHQYKRGHIKAYMIINLIFLVLSIIGFFASFAAEEVTAIKIISNLFSILLSIYFLLVIKSYYLKMDDPTNKPAIYNTA